MKKLVPLILIAFSIVSCQQPSPKKTNLTARALLTPNSTETLNGFSKSDATSMVNEFCANTKKYKNPTHTQVLITYAEFVNMLGLLDYETANPVTIPDSPGTPQTPDGIRIYFANDINTGSSVSSNNIVIVSTYKGPTYTASNGKTVDSHVDYFTHTKASGLVGTIAHDTDSKNGATLFDPCTNCNQVGCLGRITDPEHDISRYDGNQMLVNFNTQAINSRAAWFGLPQLKQFLDDMKKYKEDGLRIYFARHYKTGDPYEGLSTFVIIPTTNKKDRYDCDTAVLKHIKINSTDNGELCPIYCTGLTLGKDL